MKRLLSSILTLAAVVALLVQPAASLASRHDVSAATTPPQTGTTFTAPVSVRIGDDEYYDIPAVFTVTGENTAMFGDGNDEAIFKRYAGVLIIPDSVTYENSTLTVTEIADNALNGCSQLNAVEVGDSVKVIGHAAFCGCSSLSDISLPANLDSIADHAFHGDSHLRRLTLPAKLRKIGDEAFFGANALCYVDARNASLLQLDNARSYGSPFADLPEQTIIYTPVGMQADGDEPNVIATDSLGGLSCSRLIVDSFEVSDSDCVRGAATHSLNDLHGLQAFGQTLGKDRYPVPAHDQASLVARVSYFVGQDLKCDDYVNLNKCVGRLPSPQALGFGDGLAYFRCRGGGWFVTFTDSTAVVADTDVFAYKQSPKGQDGYLFEDSVTVIAADGGSQSRIPAMFRITSFGDKHVAFGDGTYNAIGNSTSGTLLIPDSLQLDSLDFRVTEIAADALSSCTKLTGIQLPDSITAIGADAMQGCSLITSLTLPPALLTISDRAFAGCRQMRFLDMRRATSLRADTIAPGQHFLEGCSANAIIYAPRGFAKAGGNVVTTDTAGVVQCSSSTVGGNTFDSAACANGAATHALNSWWRHQTFGQRLGTDRAPLPLAEQAEIVHRLQFFNGDSLCVTAYANHGKTVTPPSPADLALTTSLAELVCYTAGGDEVEFTDSTVINSDLMIHAFPKAVKGEDGYKLTHDVNYLGCNGDTLSCAATFVITSYADRQAQLGDGRHNAVPIKSAKLFAIPDSLIIDSTAYTITSVAETAFCGCDSLQVINIPSTVSKLAHGTFDGCQTARYIDMRRADRLSFADSASMASVFAGISPTALLYLPTGHPAVGMANVIATDSLGNTSCRSITADRLTLTPEACASGAAAYLLNRQYGERVFCQRIGEQACPVPATAADSTEICRVKFVAGFEVAHTSYANRGGTVALPDTAALKLRTRHTIKFFTLSPDGEEHPFLADNKLTSDTAVWVKEGVIVGDINGDLAVDSTDVAQLVKRVISPDSTLTDDERTASDVTADGVIDISDITALIDKTLKPDTLPDVPDTRNKAEKLNVIILGNSFACDAYFYVPFIMRNVAPKLKVSFHIFNQSGAALADQWSLLSGNKTYNSYHVYSGNGVWWSSGANQYSISDIIKNNRNSINLILLQQGSAQSAFPETYQPQLNDIVRALKDSIGSHIDVGLLLTPSYPQGSWWLTTLGSKGLTSDEMYQNTANAARGTIGTSDVSFVIPAGTAIQNARTTALDTLGRFQYHHLSSDGMHLQDGAPCLIEGYVVAQALLQHMHRSESIWDEKRTLPITKSWLETVGAREVALPVQGMVPSNIELVKRCVREALAAPFKITDCSQ